MPSTSSLPQVPLACTTMTQLATNDNSDEYHVCVSWPRGWYVKGAPTDIEVPVVYIIASQRLFLTATDAAWRLERESTKFRGLVVTVGFSHRNRENILVDQNMDSKLSANGMLCFVENEVRAYLRNTFCGLKIGREMLFGHGIGGSFALHALFTRRDRYDLYVASSPHSYSQISNDVKDEEERFLEHGTVPAPQPISNDSSQDALKSKEKGKEKSRDKGKPYLFLYCSQKPDFSARFCAEYTPSLEERESCYKEHDEEIREYQDTVTALNQSGFLEAAEFEVDPSNDAGIVLVAAMLKFLREWDYYYYYEEEYEGEEEEEQQQQQQGECECQCKDE